MRCIANRQPGTGFTDHAFGTHQAFATLGGAPGTPAYFIYRSGSRADLLANRAFRDAFANANVHTAKLMIMGMIVNNVRVAPRDKLPVIDSDQPPTDPSLSRFQPNIAVDHFAKQCASQRRITGYFPPINVKFVRADDSPLMLLTGFVL